MVSEWQPAPLPDDLFDHGGLETNRYRRAMNLLLDSLDYAWRDRNDFYAGGNHPIYFCTKKVFSQNFPSPDFFVVLDIELSSPPQGWVTWEQDGRYPDVIIELMSNKTVAIDITVKKQLYEQIFRTNEYFVYHPYRRDSLRGWRLKSNRYYPLKPDQRGWLWSEMLGYWLGVWDGTYNREEAPWLRFFDRDGNPIPLPIEELAKMQQQSQSISVKS